MIVIEAKLDALMNKLGNQERRMHSAHEVGTVERNEQKSITDEGIVHEGPYQVEEAQLWVETKVTILSPTPTFQPTTHQHRGTIRISHMEVEHNKVRDLCRTINSNILHMGFRDSNSRAARELRIMAKEGPSLLRSRC